MRLRIPLASKDVGLQQALFQLVEEEKDFPRDRVEATLSQEENQRKADL